MKKRFIRLVLLATMLGAVGTAISACAPPRQLAPPPRPPAP